LRYEANPVGWRSGLKTRSQGVRACEKVFWICSSSAFFGPHRTAGNGWPKTENGLGGEGLQVFNFQPLWPAGPSLRMKLGDPETLLARRQDLRISNFKQPPANASNALRRGEIGACLEKSRQECRDGRHECPRHKHFRGKTTGGRERRQTQPP